MVNCNYENVCDDWGGWGGGFCIFIYVLLNLLIMLIMLFKWEFVIKCEIVELLWLIMIFFELWKREILIIR